MVSNYNPKFYRKEVANGFPATAKYAGVRKDGDAYYKNINGKDYEIIFSEDVKDFLLDYYDKASNPGAYSGRDKLFDALKSRYVGISRPQVAEFLANLETSQVHQTAKVVKVHRPFTPKKPLAVWGADLVFIKNADDEPIFTLFTCIDEMSKYGFARVVADKTAAEAGDALEEIFTLETPRIPAAIRTDNGGEFKKEFDQVLKRWGVRHIRTETYNPRMNSIAERFNKTIKHLINRWLTHNNANIIDMESLRQIIDNYNNSTHSSIKVAPAELHPSADKEMNWDLIAAVKDELEDRAETLVEKNERNYPEIAPGDFVRVHRSAAGEWRKKTQLKKYGYQRQYDYELYRVLSVSDPGPASSPVYTLADEDGEKISKHFLRSQLQKVDPAELIKELDEGEYVVDKVIDKRMTGRGKNRHAEYKILYRGWPESAATWERPSESFAKAIENYENGD